MPLPATPAVALSPFATRLGELLARLGFEYVPARRGWHHEGRDLVVVEASKKCRMEHLASGKAWNNLTSTTRDPRRAAEDVANKIKMALQEWED
jgi:hypothetical protein